MGLAVRQVLQEVEAHSPISKVLIFDPDTDDLNRLAEPFERHGFEVHKCRSVDTALRCIEREDFDLALIDQVSPAFEGGRIIRHLLRYSVRTPFFVFAAHNDMNCYRQAMELGAVDYFEKPVARVDLEAIIRDFLAVPVPQL